MASLVVPEWLLCSRILTSQEAVSVEFEDVSQLLVGEGGEGGGGLWSERGGEGSLVVVQRGDVVLDGAGCAQRVDGDGQVLADAVRPVGGLVLHGGVPPSVVVDDGGGAGQGEADAGGLERDDQDAAAVPGLEVLDDAGASG